jgi:hypothetical protein
MMTLDTRDFDADLRRFSELVEIGPGIVARRIALGVFSDLLFRTPVDTGRARSNWKISVGSPDFSVLEALGSAADSTLLQVATAEQVLYRFRGNQVIYITNGLPYIERLNEGWSQQAPAGFVEAAVYLNVRPIINLLEATRP